VVNGEPDTGSVLQPNTGDRRTSDIGFVLATYAASRLFYLISGFLLASVVPTSSHQLTTTDVPPGSLNSWSHWDGEHYVALARDGHLEAPSYISPASSRCTRCLSGPPRNCLADISPRSSFKLGNCHLSPSPANGLLLHLRHSRSGMGRKSGAGAILAFDFFPTSFFLNATYTESLFLALLAGSLWAMKVKKNFLLACILAGLAPATRNVGSTSLLLCWLFRSGWLNPSRKPIKGLSVVSSTTYAATPRSHGKASVATHYSRFGRHSEGCCSSLLRVLDDPGSPAGHP